MVIRCARAVHERCGISSTMLYEYYVWVSGTHLKHYERVQGFAQCCAWSLHEACGTLGMFQSFAFERLHGVASYHAKSVMLFAIDVQVRPVSLETYNL